MPSATTMTEKLPEPSSSAKYNENIWIQETQEN